MKAKNSPQSRRKLHPTASSVRVDAIKTTKKKLTTKFEGLEFGAKISFWRQSFLNFNVLRFNV